jgi:AcrR family transcriptional regulator
MAETRKALIQAALALYTEKGLDVPIEAVCARAGYTRGAFYAHFEGRDALMVEAMKARRDATFAALLAALGPTPSVPPLLALLGELVSSGSFPQKGSVRTVEFLGACRRSTELRAAQTQLLDATVARLGEVVRHDQNTKAVRSDVDAASLATLLVVLEAGVEVMADLGWTYDVKAVAGLASELISPARHDVARRK